MKKESKCLNNNNIILRRIIETNITFPKNPNFEMLFAIENAYSSIKSRWCLVYRKLK